jgi:hypothetical protein
MIIEHISFNKNSSKYRISFGVIINNDGLLYGQDPITINDMDGSLGLLRVNFEIRNIQPLEDSTNRMEVSGDFDSFLDARRIYITLKELKAELRRRENREFIDRQRSSENINPPHLDSTISNETKDEKITPKLEENDIIEEKSNIQNALDFIEI